ncbi:MAG: cytidylate kinase-like family protein [Bacteroidales bacterium]|nr:cytidylate kinase-like family protein [Bacteroidales bacterium]
MTDLLLKYMMERFNEQEAPKPKPGPPGPVITISRQLGCSGNDIAKKLIDRINAVVHEKGRKKTWKHLNKEIIDQSAKELNLHPNRVKEVMDAKERNAIDHVLSSLYSKYYKSDRTIKRTISEVVKSIAIEGHIIIVGRGGVGITRDIKNSFHIRLEGSVEWRAQYISKKHEISHDEAIKYILDIDRKREKIIESFCCEDVEPPIYDVMYNCCTIPQDDIVDSLFTIISKRNMI